MCDWQPSNNLLPSCRTAVDILEGSERTRSWISTADSSCCALVSLLVMLQVNLIISDALSHQTKSKHCVDEKFFPFREEEIVKYRENVRKGNATYKEVLWD